MTLRRDARRVPHAGRRLVAALCFVVFAEACQSLLVFTPEPTTPDASADDAATVDAIASDASTDDAPIGDAVGNDRPAVSVLSCSQRDAAFCVEFVGPADLTTAVWDQVDSFGVSLTDAGATSPPFAALLETPGAAQYTTLAKTLRRSYTRVRASANVRTDKNAYLLVVGLGRPETEDLVFLGGIFADHVDLLVQSSFGTIDQQQSPSGSASLLDVMQPVELVIERQAGADLRATFGIVGGPAATSQITLPTIDEVQINVGPWNTSEATKVTVDDVALSFD